MDIAEGRNMSEVEEEHMAQLDRFREEQGARKELQREEVPGFPHLLPVLQRGKPKVVHCCCRVFLVLDQKRQCGSEIQRRLLEQVERVQ